MQRGQRSAESRRVVGSDWGLRKSQGGRGGEGRAGGEVEDSRGQGPGESWCSGSAQGLEVGEEGALED